MDRKTRELYSRVLEQAVLLVYQGAIRMSVHGRRREGLRSIERADAEATITGSDANVVAHNYGHPEGTTYRIAGRRANGDEMSVVIAFDADTVSQSTMMTIVTVIYPQR